MASAQDDVFLRVEAVLSPDWIKRSGKDVTAILEEIEILGIEQINFRLGNHILVGSLEQLVRIREHFVGKAKKLPAEKRAPAYADFFADTPQRNDLYKTSPFSANREREGRNGAGTDWTVKSDRGYGSPRKEPDPPKEQQIPKELMVDNDIWEYIENKKSEELKDVETMFAATLAKSEDDSGVLKIVITPKSKDTTPDEVGLMHETLVGLYQETFMKCVIEKHEVHFSDTEAELMLDYISDKFPAVFAKRCIYNDDFLFIGPPRTAREARQQFQVLAQRMKRGQLKAKVDNRTALVDYNVPRGGYGDRYDFNEDDPYKRPPYEYTNDFQNVPDEEEDNRPRDTIAEDENCRDNFEEDEIRKDYFEQDENNRDTFAKEEIRKDNFKENENNRDTFAEDESRGGDASEPLINELSEEEDEPKVEERISQSSASKDFYLPASDWNNDRNRRGKFTDDVKHQSGASSLVYWRDDKDEVVVDRRAGSDVEEDDWKRELPAEKIGIKKDSKRADEFRHDGKFERSCRTGNTPDLAQNVGKTSGSALSLYDDDEVDNEAESIKAAKLPEDIMERKKEDTKDDGPIIKKDALRIDANSIIHRSADLGACNEESASQSFLEFLNDSTDEKTGSTESLEKKPQKSKKKKSYDSGPKVRIIKQAIPGFTVPDDNLQKEAERETKAVNEPKVEVIGKTSSRDTTRDKGASCRTVKSSQKEVSGVPFRVLNDSEERELKEVFQAQRKGLKKMKFDSSSSEDDSERGATALKPERYDKKGKLAHQMIEELMTREDEASRKLLQALLEKAANEASGGDVPVDNAKVENSVVGKATSGAGKGNADVPAAERPVDSVRRAKSKNTSAIPQPPDGVIGCVIDKAFHLPGHDKSGTIEINISFEAGDQTDDQLEPGRPYKAMTLKAFLPASGDGRETLRLVKAAFAARKLFTLEEKADEDIIVPNGVVFKDNIDLYPDPGYLPKVIEQLRLLTEQQDK